MYASATPPLQVVVFHEAARGMKPLEERTLPESMQEQLARFRIERHALGQLRSVDDVGRSILDGTARPPLGRRRGPANGARPEDGAHEFDPDPLCLRAG